MHEEEPSFFGESNDNNDDNNIENKNKKMIQIKATKQKVDLKKKMEKL